MHLNINANAAIPNLPGETLQAILSAAERLRLGELSDTGVREVRSQVQAHNPVTGFMVDVHGSLACGLELKGRQLARFIASEGWSHYFENNRESQTRWVLEKETGFVLFAQVMGRHGWRPATRIEKEDLAESLVEANEMLTRAHEFDVALLRDLPDWTAQGAN